MGCTHRFRCHACQYVAEVSGGPDQGFVVATRTMFCLDCGELRDIAVSYPGKDPRQDWDREHLNDEHLGRCGTCGGRDLEPWTRGDPCPLCLGAMIDEGGVLDWD